VFANVRLLMIPRLPCALIPCVINQLRTLASSRTHAPTRTRDPPPPLRRVINRFYVGLATRPKKRPKKSDPGSELGVIQIWICHTVLSYGV